jgi:hypothetical protein
MTWKPSLLSTVICILHSSFLTSRSLLAHAKDSDEVTAVCMTGNSSHYRESSSQYLARFTVVLQSGTMKETRGCKSYT